MSLLQVDTVSIGFGGILAVDDVTFDLAPATILGIIGPNGSGKTTLLNILNGVHPPDSGAVHFAGTETTQLRPHQLTSLGIMRTFQNAHVFTTVTTYQNMMVPLLHEDVLDDEAHERVMGLLAFVELTDAEVLRIGITRVQLFGTGIPTEFNRVIFGAILVVVALYAQHGVMGLFRRARGRRFTVGDALDETALGQQAPMKALLLASGWSGHRPADFAAWARQLLTSQGFTVEIVNQLEPLTDDAFLRSIDLIVPIWSSQGSSHSPEHGNLTYAQEQGLMRALERGTGLGGWHGHMADAFRDRTTYHFMVGGQFVGHPPGWPDNPAPQRDFNRYQVNIRRSDDPVVAGIDDFWIEGEQYYMHVDPFNEVLATTTFSGDHLPWIDGAVVPVVWKKRWGRGRIFYCSIGHEVRELNLPPVHEIMRRGLAWAARPVPAGEGTGVPI